MSVIRALRGRRHVGVLAATAVVAAAGLVTVTGSAASAAATGGAGATLPYVEVQAENAATNGTIIGPAADYNTLPGEASYRKAVTLTGQGKYVEFTTPTATNSIDFRYSIPDSAGGAVYTSPLSLYINGVKQPSFALTNAYSWYYSSYPFSNQPGSNAHHFYDELNRLFPTTYPAGTTFRLQVDADATAASTTVDFADFENVAAPLTQPAGSVSIATYGADATGTADSTSAMTQAIAAAGAGGTVWIPVGTFKIHDHVIVNNVTIKGAGMWYSRTTGDRIGFYGNDAPNPSTNVHLADFAIFGNVQERNDADQVNGIGGALTSSTVDRVWIEHTKVGAWMDGPFDNLVMSGLRLRNFTADGVNFHNGVTNSRVTNSDVRNAGDDGLATWAEHNADVNDSFDHNTVQYPILANGIAIYGGHDNFVTDNRVIDSGLTQGGGIHVAQRFASTTLGRTDVLRNTIIRSGNLDPNWQFGVGALWFDARDGSMSGLTNVDNLLIQQSPYEAIQFVSGSNISNVKINNATIQNTGTFVVQEQVGGAATITNTTATGTQGPSSIYSCSTQFTLTDGGGNSGVFGTPFCGPWTTPTLPPYLPDNVSGVSVSPAAVSFGSVATGATSAAQTVTVTNTGTTSATVGTIAVTGDFSKTTACGTSLAAGASCTVSVTFAPTAAGNRTGTLSVTANGSANAVPLSGTGVAPGPILGANPGALTFGSTVVGATSATQAVTIANTGTTAANVSGVAVTGDYTQTNTCATVAVGSSCTVTVAFKPTASGTRTGTLTVTSNANNSPTTVALSGAAVGTDTNIAQGRTASASSETNGVQAAATAVDGDASTYWESASNAFPQWLQVDLGAATSIGKVTLKLPPASAWATRTQTLSVQTSTNGTAFSTVASGTYTFNPADATPNTAAITLPATSARYVRVTITANSGWPAGQVSELQVFPSGTVTPSAVLATSPASLTFAGQTVGSVSAAQTVTVTNTGTAAATLSGVLLSGDFSQTNTCGATLTVGASCAVSVKFSPAATGNRTGTLTVTSNATNSPTTVALSGTGTSAATASLSASPSSLTFGSTTVGSPSAAQNVIITNTGGAAATISGVASTGDFAQTSTCSGTLAAGATCTVAVTFQPTATGARTGSVTVTSNAANSPTTIALSGTGAGTATGNLALNKATSESSHSDVYPSGNVTDGNASTYWESANNAFPQWVQVDLGSAQSITKVTFKLPPTWGARTETLSIQGSTNGTTWTTLAPSGVVQLDPATGSTASVTFTAASARYVRVNVTANSSWPAGQFSEVEVYGPGGTGTATLAASPANLSYGSTTVGATSAAQTVTISNTGGASASVSGVTIGGDFADTTTCGATLAAGASCTASVTFRPTAAGGRTGSLTVASNASNPSLTVALSGTGTAPTSATLTANPTSLTFAGTTVGSSSATQSVTIANTGTAAATLSGVSVSGEYTDTTTCGASLAAGASCTVTVTFRPTGTGTRTGTLTVASNATNPALAVALSGTGNAASTATITANPTGLTYGSTAVGSSSATQTVTFTNTGGASANLFGVTAAGDFSRTTTCGTTLGAGSTCTATVTFSPTAAGTRTGTLTFSSSATNSTLIVALSGTGGTTTASDQAAGKTMTSSSDTFTFVAANANDGNLATYWEGAVPSWLNVAMRANVTVSSVVVKLNPDAAWGTRTQTFSIEGRDQAGGSYTTIKPSATYTFTQGSNGVTIPVSATAADLRLSFTNNSGASGGQVAELQVLGVPAPNPDLAVSDVASSPATPLETDAVTLSAKVTNIGTASAAASTVSFSLGTTKVGTANVGALAAGASATVSVNVGPQTAGAYATSAVVDEANAIVEQSESNNSATGAALTVAAVQSADLVATTGWSPSSPSGGQTVTFTTTVKNQGNQPSSAAAHGVTVTIKDQTGAVVKTLTPTAPSGVIAAGASVNVTAGTWTAVNGKYTVTSTVAADSAELAVKQANNTTVQSLSAGRGASMPYDSYEAEDGTLAGGATTVGPNRTIGDLAGEASGRKAVRLNSTGASVSWTARAATNTLDVRFSIPDGTTTTLGVFNGATQVGTVTLVSKYAWLYGAEASPQNSGTGPRHIYDEANVVLSTTVPAGATLTVRNTTGADITVDFVQLELATPIANPDPTHLVTVTGLDTAAIQAALNTANQSATATGIYLPAGDYQVAQKFQIGQKPLQVVGAGPWFTRLIAPQGQENTDIGFNPNGAGATGSQFRNFAVFGNYTSRADGSGQVFPLTNVTNITIDNVWVTHSVVMVWGQNVDSSTFTNNRIDDTFADGITLANDSSNNVLRNMAAHATGDDSFALFNAQDVHAGTVSNNLEENLTAILTWRAAGFAVYGGSGNTFRNLYAADMLTYPGLTISSINFGIPFVGFSGTTTFDNISIVRSGGHFWGQQVFPALWLNSGDGAFTGIRISNVDIVDPTYDGVMFQTKYVGSSATNPVADTVLTNVTVDRANEPRPDGSNVDATASAFNLTGRAGNAVWCNAAPEPGQGPAIGAVTFTGLTMTNNSHDIVNTCPGFTITRN